MEAANEIWNMSSSESMSIGMFDVPAGGSGSMNADFGWCAWMYSYVVFSYASEVFDVSVKSDLMGLRLFTKLSFVRPDLQRLRRYRREEPFPLVCENDICGGRHSCVFCNSLEEVTETISLGRAWLISID